MGGWALKRGGASAGSGFDFVTWIQTPEPAQSVLPPLCKPAHQALKVHPLPEATSGRPGCPCTAGCWAAPVASAPPRCESHKSIDMARHPCWRTATMKGAASARGQPWGGPRWLLSTPALSRAGLQPRLLTNPSPSCKQCLPEVKAGPRQCDPSGSHTSLGHVSPPLAVALT